ncbi:transposase [Streptomyces sp. NPDC021225]|uniref:transposase n=1 Tax=Streptomyces sp. NPDC021225 TaxID=3365121 RepID=UPI0037A81929
MLITAGHRGDSPQFEPVMEAIQVPRLGPGRPRKRPDRIRADKAYDSRRNRSYLRRRGIKATTPVLADRVRNQRRLGSRGGRPPEVRQDRLLRASRGRVWDQSPQEAPGRGNEI